MSKVDISFVNYIYTYNILCCDYKYNIVINDGAFTWFTYVVNIVI